MGNQLSNKLLFILFIELTSPEGCEKYEKNKVGDV
jgi:hypothetical protein